MSYKNDFEGIRLKKISATNICQQSGQFTDTIVVNLGNECNVEKERPFEGNCDLNVDSNIVHFMPFF